jgi:HSP20 family protein
MTPETSMTKQESQLVRPERTRDVWSYTPKVDVAEMDDELLVLADLPGADAKSMDVSYEQGLLTIHGKVEPRQDESTTSYLLCEYGVGDYYRTLSIGEGIDADKISAELRNGVLELHLPKTQAYKPHKITVKGS